MNSLFKFFKSNDTLYWLYAKSLYNAQRYINDVFEANQIIEGLWLGGVSSVCNRDSLQERNIELIITAVYGSSAIYPYDFNYSRSNLKDIEEENILPEIEKMVPQIHEELLNKKGVLVSCVKGRSRSCTIVAAYLIKYHHMSTDEAIEFIKSKRSQIEPNPSYLISLKIYELKIRNQRDSRNDILNQDEELNEEMMSEELKL